MRRRLIPVLAGPLILCSVLVAPTLAASTPSRTTFADVIAGSRLVVLAQIHVRTDGGLLFTVERVLKGDATARQLSYPPLGAAPPIDHWSEAVIAFAHPETDDFRAPTIAWHVAANGTIDPEGFQQYPGLPATLAAMLRYFGAPATDTSSGATMSSASSGRETASVFFVGLAGLAGLALGLSRFARRRDALIVE